MQRAVLRALPVVALLLASACSSTMPRQLNATAGGETGTAALDPAPAVAATAVETTRASGVTAPSATPVRSGGGPGTPMIAPPPPTGGGFSPLGDPPAPL